jgi:hypothetical protein
MPLMNKKGAGFSALVSAGLALLFAVIAGFLPPFSQASPERLNLHYVERDGRGRWIADPVRHLPESLARAGDFSRVTPLPLFGRGYLGAAGGADNRPPDAAASRNGDHLTITLHGSSQADGMMVIFPAPLRLESVNEGHFVALPPSTRFSCDTPDCANAVMNFSGHAASFDVIEMRHGLPAKGKSLLDARPDNAVPSSAGDQTFLVGHVTASGG